MIIKKTTSYSKEEIEKLKEVFELYIKTVIDIKNNICSAGYNLHVDSEQTFLKEGSEQKNLWGGGVNTETKDIDFIGSEQDVIELTKNNYSDLACVCFQFIRS